MGQKLYKAIVTAATARENCANNGNREWFNKWEEKIDEYNNMLPSGSGFDCGSSIADATENKIIIDSSYHRMNDAGMYDGWIDFSVAVKPSLLFGFTLTVSGRFGKHQDLKEYIADCFEIALNETIE